MTTKIISISGDYRTGKTTLAHKLAKALPNAQHFAFADRLKMIVASRYPEQAVNIFADEKTTETRNLLGVVGREYLNRFGDSCWSDVLFNEINKTKLDYAIISDTRFREEFARCYLEDATFIHLGASYTGYCFKLLYQIPHYNFVSRPDASQVLSTLTFFN